MRPKWNQKFLDLDNDEGDFQIKFWTIVCFPTQVFSPSVFVDVALQKQLEELLNSCYYIPSKEEASQVEVDLPND